MKANNKGQALIEYILIITLITSVTAVAILVLGKAIRDGITKATCNVTGGKYVEGIKAGTGTCDNIINLEE